MSMRGHSTAITSLRPRRGRIGEMKFASRFLGRALRLFACLAGLTTSCLAQATLTQQIDPPEVNLGDQTTVSITIQNGSVTDLHLPPVDGLQVTGSGSSTSFTFYNGSVSRTVTFNFAVVATKSGDINIPAFDVH